MCPAAAGLAGTDTVGGADGADVLSLGDGEQDAADCGSGPADRVVKDAVDTAAGCETVQTVSAPSGC